MDLASSARQANYRWLVTPHWELDFYGLPRRFPWPKDVASKINPQAAFPFDVLRQGIGALLEEQPNDPAHEGWKRFRKLEEYLPRFRAALEDSDFPKINAVLSEMETVHPCPFIDFQRAFLFEQEGQCDQAIACYQRIIDRAPKLAFAWRRMGQLYAETDRRLPAINCYWRVLEHVPSDPASQEALTALGVLVKLLRDVKDPNSIFYLPAKAYHGFVEQRCKDLAKNPEELLDYVEAILQRGSSKGVPLEALEAVARQLPTDPRAQLCYGIALRLDKRWSRAAVWLREFIEKFPEIGAGYYELAEAFLQGQREHDGREMLDRCLAVDPNLTAAIVRKFNLDLQRPDPEMETHLLQFAAQRRSWAAYFQSSRLVAGRGDLQAAVNQAAQAYALNSEQEPLLLHYARMLTQSGEDDRLVAALKPKVDSHRYSCELAWLYAQALHRLNLTKDAARVLQRELDRVLPAEWRARIATQADLWLGTAAESAVMLERYPTGALKRSIVIPRGEEVVGVQLPAAQPLPCAQNFKDQPLEKGQTAARLTLWQGFPGGAKTPLNLGCFCASQLVPPEKGGVPLEFAAEATAEGILRLRAFQNGRKLPIAWEPAS